MEAWTVRLLGVSHARRAEETARLRSHKARAVLASLLLPPRLSAPVASILPPPAALSRQTLAERFWDGMNDPRVHLRQALASLKEQFGNACFEGDHNAIRAAPGAFTTDIDRLRTIYARAMTAPPGERLPLLIEAEGEIGGLFLEGCERLGDNGEVWLIGRRAEAHGWIAEILLALAGAFEEAGNAHGAAAAARRAMRFQPESEKAQEIVWRLTARAGQEAAPPALLPSDTFEQALERIAARETAHLTGSETRLFQALYQTKIAALPAPVQKALPRLAAFPAPFPAELATMVAKTPRRTILALSRTPLLQHTGDLFSLSKAVRECAWRTVPSATKNQIAKRLADFCATWATQALAQDAENPSPSPFASLAQAEPFLTASLRWILKQPLDPAWMAFFNNLKDVGLSELAGEALFYLDRLQEDETLPARSRCLACYVSGNILYKRREFAQAIPQYERALFIAASDPDYPYHATVRVTLGNAYHYAGDSRTGLFYLREAMGYLERLDDGQQGMSGCLRVQAEILNHLGEFEEALRVCEDAVRLRRALFPPNAAGQIMARPVADALFWQGATLIRLKRFVEAAPCLEEALAIWQDTGEGTGMGFCLRLMGKLHAEQGRFAEARAHLRHAILLHERAGDGGSRAAAVEAEADVFRQQGRDSEAQALYEECFAFYKECGSKSAERLQGKIQSCLATPEVS